MHFCELKVSFLTSILLQCGSSFQLSVLTTNSKRGQSLCVNKHINPIEFIWQYDTIIAVCSKQPRTLVWGQAKKEPGLGGAFDPIITLFFSAQRLLGACDAGCLPPGLRPLASGAVRAGEVLGGSGGVTH